MLPEIRTCRTCRPLIPANHQLLRNPALCPTTRISLLSSKPPPALFLLLGRSASSHTRFWITPRRRARRWRNRRRRPSGTRRCNGAVRARHSTGGAGDRVVGGWILCVIVRRADLVRLRRAGAVGSGGQVAGGVRAVDGGFERANRVEGALEARAGRVREIRIDC